MKKITRNCPICNSERSNKICELLYKYPNNYIQNNDTSVVTSEIVCCSDCNFVFNLTPFNFEQLEDYNKNNNRYESFDIYNFYNYAIDYVKQNFENNIKILDVGCSTGKLLAQLKKLGFNNVFGLDPSEVSINKLRENVEGVSGIIGSVYNDIAAFDNEFDLIILTNVLEHLLDPKAAINSIIKWLKIDGVLYIEVPSANYYHLNDYNFSNLVCMEHINHFTEQSLNNLMSTLCFSRVFLRHDANKCVFQTAYKITKKEENIKKNDLDAFYSIRQSYSNFLDLKSKCKSLLEIYKEKQFVIWGMSHLAMALYVDVFSELKIEFIVDIDKNKQGLLIGDIPVKKPESLFDFNGTIIVLSNTTTDSVLKSIESFGFKNNVLILK